MAKFGSRDSTNKKRGRHKTASKIDNTKRIRLVGYDKRPPKINVRDYIERDTSEESKV